MSRRSPLVAGSCPAMGRQEVYWPPCRSGPDRQDYFSNGAACDFRKGQDEIDSPSQSWGRAQIWGGWGICWRYQGESDPAASRPGRRRPGERVGLPIAPREDPLEEAFLLLLVTGPLDGVVLLGGVLAEDRLRVDRVRGRDGVDDQGA